MTQAGVGEHAAIAGYGNQGRPQAQMIRRAGVRVVIGARPGSASGRRAAADGFEVRSPGDAVASASWIGLLIPDEAIPDLWNAVAPRVASGAAVVCAHGFSLLYGGIEFAPGLDVVVVSPAGPGRLLESAPGRTPLAAYLAVHREGSGAAMERARTWASWLGCSPLWPTTVREETEVDLFGEQTVLCGGMNALVRTAFEVLVERGYAPEIAYLECVHQLKHLADLLHERGVAGLRGAISGTALFGDLTRGPRVIGPSSRVAMEAILDEIRSGGFAREWQTEVQKGRPTLGQGLRESTLHPIEEARRRALGLPKPAPDPV